MHPAIERIRSALKQESFTSGTCKVPVEHCDLYYESSTPESFPTLNRLNLVIASDEDLIKLISACDAAPFGRGSKTVFDESFRKALKLDLSQFSMPFELANTDILQKIQQDLVKTDVALRRRVRAEPYKLNIYDQGAFFKAHQDTPRAKNMFGSLVVIFPTPHEGGTLILSSDGEQWSFDGSKMLSASTPDAPEVAFVAFYSDTTHEVLPVISGCRITLTYNLYFEDTAYPAQAKDERYKVVYDALAEIIDDKEAFPVSNVLCFGLAHQYSLTKDEEKNSGAGYYLEDLEGHLKGSDALVYAVCEDMGLDVSLRAFYRDCDYCHYDDDTVEEFYIGSRFIGDSDHADRRIESTTDLYRHGFTKVGTWRDNEIFSTWITPKSKGNRLRSAYLAHGNAASVDFVYGDVCLLVQRHDSGRIFYL